MNDRRRLLPATTCLVGLFLLNLVLWGPPSSQPSPPIATGQSSDATFSSPSLDNARITDGTSPFPHQVEPYIVIDSLGTLFVGWKEAFTPDGPGRRVGFARSQDGGLTWSPNELMERRASNRFQSDPWLVLDESDRLYYSRLDFENGPGNGIAITHSDDGGGSWSPIVEVDDQSGFADKESLASDGNGTLYLAYGDVIPSGQDTSMRFSHSLDRGATWAATSEIGGGPGTFISPVIATRPNGTVYVAWLDWLEGNILFARSWNRGVTWGAPVQVNPVAGTTAFDEAHVWWLSLPSIVADAQGRISLAWPDGGTGDLDVLVAQSEDDGTSWSFPVRINDDASGREQRMVSLALDPDDRLHAAWFDNRTGNLNVFYSNSTDGGETWSANARVTTAETPARFERPGDYLGLAADRHGAAHIVWTDGRGGDLDIYFATPRPPDERDREAPLIKILSPEEGQNFTSTQLTVSGTAQDNVAVDRVEISADLGATWIQANGTSSWSGSLAISLGESLVLARATDTSGNNATASVTVSVLAPSEEFLAPDPFYLILLAAAIAAVVLIAWRFTKRRRT